MRVHWYTKRSAPPSTATRNIETMLKLEEEFQKQRSWSECLADGVAAFAGSVPFICLHLVAIALWVVVNTGVFFPWVPVRPFDHYPFNFLGLMLAYESVILASFVLIKQNRMSYRADHRSHLDLQVNLLAEQEATKILQMLTRMSRHLGLEQVEDQEAAELASNIPLEQIARDLDRRLRNGETEDLARTDPGEGDVSATGGRGGIGSMPPA